jgi:hypothetical protein
MSKSATKCLVACIAALLVVLVVVLMIMSPTGRRYGDYVSGMWTGDPTFLQKAGLSDMQMYIGPKGHDTRQGYLIMADTNGTLISNQAFEITAEKSRTRCQNLRNHFRTQDKHTIDVEVQFDSKTTPPVMPSELTITVSAADGSMSIYSTGEGKLYGFMWKDMAASAAAARAYEDRDEGSSSKDSDED